MTAPQIARDLVAAVAAKAGLPPLPFDGQGVAVLPVDDRTEVLFIVDDRLPGSMDLVCAVGPLPDDDRRTPLMRRLLAANLFGQGTGGAVLSIDPETDAMVLHRRVALERSDADGLTADLENLLNEVERWRTAVRPGAGEEGRA